MPLRYYQQEAKQAVFDYWSTTAGNPLVDMATGTGKSITMASLIQDIVTGWPGMRIFSVTHVIELVEGNYKELLGIWPFAPAGTYASALGTRDRHSQIIFGQLQTVWNKAVEIGHVDVLVIDEVHLVPRKDDTMYRKFIDALLAINPDMKIVGFTATVYRLDSGRLDEGDDRLFDKVVYSYGVREGIDDGYLTPVSSKPVATHLDVTGVGKSMGDFAKGALQEAVDKDRINRAVLDEVFTVEGYRKSALFFCSGIKHAGHFRDIVREYGRSCEVISGTTPKAERRRLIEDFKAGKIWSLANDNVLSTGTNLPCVDLIVDCAPTASAGRYVQRVGRGTRVVWPIGFKPDDTVPDDRRAAIASGPKPNCRYMDFASNIQRHGPIDAIVPKRPGKGTGEAPIRLCPECQEICHAAAKECSCCGYPFPPSEVEKIAPRASTLSILSVREPTWSDVTSRTFAHHASKDSTRPDSIKITYRCGVGVYNQWVGPGQGRGDRYWAKHGGERPFPKTVTEWLDRQHELVNTARVTAEREGRYFNIKDYEPGTERTTAPETTPAGNTYDWDDEIPF